MASRLVRAALTGTRAVLGSGRRGAEGRCLASTFTGLVPPLGTNSHIGPLGPDGLPIYVDWSKYGAVTPIQNQGDCDNCWAFGVTALIEGAYFIHSHELMKLSEQHLIDGNNLRNFGCEGGSSTEALEYILRNGGIINAHMYPYKAAQFPIQRLTGSGVKIADYSLHRGTEKFLKWAVAQGPVLASVGADVTFPLIHCWLVVRHCEKFEALEMNKRPGKSRGLNLSAESNGSQGQQESSQGQQDSTPTAKKARPPGRKQSKDKLKRDEGDDEYKTLMKNLMVIKNDEHALRMERWKKELCLEQRKLDIEEQRLQWEQEKHIMFCNVNTLDKDQRTYVLAKRAKIAKRAAISSSGGGIAGESGDFSSV